MPKFTFLDLAEKVLLETGHPMTPGEMWDYAEAKSYASLVGTKGSTPEATLGSRMYVDIQRPDSKFARTPSRPARFYLKSSPAPVPASVPALVKKKTMAGIHERALHPFVAFFAKYTLGGYVKTIHHEQASKGAFGEWVFPDLVGFTYPIGHWTSEVLDIGKALGSSPLRLFSFEVKKSLSLSNLRQAFFQVVSNSSWAHKAYLVAADVSQEPEFLQELRRLCSAHGIGVVKLDLDSPNDAAILIEAQERRDLDWDTLNKLGAMSEEFRFFIINVRNQTQVQQIYESSYDRVMDEDGLLAHLKSQQPPT